MYGNAFCPYCGAARMLLKKKSIEFEDIPVTGDAARLEEMMERSGRRTVPQIFIGEHHVGGFDELNALEQSGELDKLLAG
jgi:glutaredoxin 3